ncbi:restriction endonuclease subunit S [Clostridium perfringens]|uniref:restriction endonuclease subunit S n=1 Tax=Clostridium perfringens TaxID=1502 RepID=UPI003F853411
MSRNVPKLRFKGFEDEWENYKLGSFSEKITEKNKGFKVKNVISNSAKNGLISQRDFFEKDIANKNNIDGYYIIKNGDFVYNPRKSNEAPYGPINKYKFKDDGVVSPLYFCFRINNKVSNEYLEEYFKSSKWYRYVHMNSDQGARHDRVSIKDSEVMNMKIKLPSLQEQEKIANFLSKVDSIIEKQEKKVEYWNSYKKGMMQKIFSQKIRFKDKKGRNYPEWEKVHLNKFVERVVRKNKDNVSKRPLTISAQYGLVDQEEFFNKLVASKNLEGYYLLKNGEFAYNKSYSTGYPFGAIKRLDKYENGAVSTLYICFKVKNNINSDFIVQYFESSKWHKEIAMIAVEGARNHGLLNVSVSDFFETIHYIPCLEEQNKISKFLLNIDNILFKENKKLEELVQWKKGLLQQMFI